MTTEKKRILVVDDEACVTRQIKRNLEQTQEFVVAEENQANNALKTARNFKPDMIILDVMMPEMDGGALASEFQSSATFKNVPIVFLTAAVTREEEGMRGGERFLAKPVNTLTLVQCLKENLR